jgi:hypothetical protein
MNETFGEHIERMPAYMEKLLASDLLTRDQLACVPQSGIYVFYENGSAVYVGRSNTMRSRLQAHSRPSSGHGSATFAFLLALRHRDCPQCDGMTRSDIQAHEAFRVLYDECKLRVANMQVRVVEIEDQVDQTLFEVYAALELATEHNDWRTH